MEHMALGGRIGAVKKKRVSGKRARKGACEENKLTIEEEVKVMHLSLVRVSFCNDNQTLFVVQGEIQLSNAVSPFPYPESSVRGRYLRPGEPQRIRAPSSSSR